MGGWLDRIGFGRIRENLSFSSSHFALHAGRTRIVLVGDFASLVHRLSEIFSSIEPSSTQELTVSFSPGNGSCKVSYQSHHTDASVLVFPKVVFPRSFIFEIKAVEEASSQIDFLSLS